MEELILKSVELGTLGIFSLILLTKGVTALTALTKAIDNLSDKITLQNIDLKQLKAELKDIRDLIIRK